MKTWLVLASTALVAPACSSKTANGGCDPECPAGSVCNEGECRHLCVSDDQCEPGEICDDSLCVTGARANVPRIDGIDANGTVDNDPTHAGHRYDGELYVTGAHLAGASLILSNGVTSWPLDICESADDAISARLPSTFPSGSDTYLLTATNQAGACETTLPVLQGETGPTGPTGATGALDTAQVDAMNAAIAAGAVPVGTIVPFAGDSSEVPAGWVLCDGAEVGRVGNYGALFAVIGIDYGTGDGVATFNLPNLSGRFPLGTGGGHALASDGGAEEHTLTINELPSHDHGGTSGQMNNGGGITRDWLEYSGSGKDGGFARTGSNFVGGNQLRAHTHPIAAQGGGAAHSIMPPFLTLNYIIKY